MKKPLIVLIVALGLIRPAWADYQDGEAAYLRGDYQTALRELKPLAERGNAEAQYWLGRMYLGGNGVPENDTRGLRWIRKAAEQGDAEAQVLIGYSYFGSDWAEAVKWFYKASIQGNAQAAFAIGSIHALSENDAVAAEWFLKAAERGHVDAQHSLGAAHYFGTGVPQDRAEGVRWYRRAAEQRHAEAQWTLGLAYYVGAGVPQDYAAAERWYRKSAEQGNAGGQARLGFLYSLGHGVPQDFVLSHMWMNLAAAQGEEIAKEGRDSLVPLMTPAQVAEAQRLARAWHPPGSLTVEQFNKSLLGQPAPAPQPRAAHADPEQQAHVARVQQGLTSLGYDPGPNDGIVGPKTRAAIRAFQADHDLAVTGEVSVKLEAAVFKQILLGPKTARFEKDSTGSGFLVSSKGHILTNHHVVKDCEEVRLPTGAAVQVIAGDAQSDLALLEGPGTNSKFATFSQGRGVRPGDDIVVVGFPLHGLLTTDLVPA